MKLTITSTIIAFVMIISFSFVQSSFAQGCVAIRDMSCSGGSMGDGSTGLFEKGQWQVALNYRYFKSFRHFRGRTEEANRVEDGTEVINHFNGFDLGVTYGLSNRLSLSLILPATFIDRSSLYEHYGNSIESNPNQLRFHTQGNGIGDMRLAANYWLLDPAEHHMGNISLGLGIKAPTGNAGVEDDFHKLDQDGQDYTVRKPVDQSIQPGDGGWGVDVELQGFEALSHKMALYYNGFYLFNPRNVNNTLRSPGADPSNPFNYFSVPDQYAMRLGLSYYPLSNISFSLGGRMEGIPARDVIGKDEGFRRPGYVISIEPGISYVHNRVAFNLNVPVAIERNRIKNVQDIMTGKHGDAAFADYLITVGVAYRFAKKQKVAFKSWEDLNK